MSRMNRIVKLLSLAAIAVCVALAGRAGEDAAPQPHMMYFYNPSCRLCTKTNVVVGDTEEKYKDRMSFQRFNISDPESGTDNVLYMFDLMDEMEVPESDNTTLVVFIGHLEQVEGEVFFTPRRVLVEGDEIIEKLDREVSDFLATEAKGGPLGVLRPAAFFLRNGVCVAHSS